MTPNTLSRRTVLRGAGATIALPLLEVMSATRLLTAAESRSETPLRMTFCYVPNGAHMPDWTPQDDGANYKLTPTLERLADHKDHFNVLSGLALDGAAPTATAAVTMPAASPLF